MKKEDLKYLLPFSELQKTAKRAPYDGYPANPVTLGEQVKKRRMDLGLTQKEGAKKIGVTKMFLIDLEFGRVEPNPNQLTKINQFLN